MKYWKAMSVISIISPFLSGMITVDEATKGLLPMVALYRGLYGGYGMTTFGWIGGLAMLIGVVLIGVVIYLLASSPRHTANRYAVDAVNILKERLAKGEIDEETYERLLKTIG